MIATLLIIGIALAWLGYETDWLTVRLESTEYQRAKLATQAKTEYGNTDMGKVKADMPEDMPPLKPTIFTPLDMPETTGELNIIGDYPLITGIASKSVLQDYTPNPCALHLPTHIRYTLITFGCIGSVWTQRVSYLQFLSGLPYCSLSIRQKLLSSIAKWFAVLHCCLICPQMQLRRYLLRYSEYLLLGGLLL